MKALLLLLLFTCPVFGEEKPVAESPLPQEEPVPAPPIPQLVDIFQASESPGSGALSYKYDGEKNEKIEFGKATGVYGLGMVFNGSVLPEPFKKDFQKNQILQIVLGTLKAKEGDHLPQFAAATLLATKIPTQRTVFRLAIPNSSELKNAPVAILLFTSPSLKQGSTDEEKLKETMFAESGNLVVTPVGTKTVTTIKAKGGKYFFYHQELKIEWAAKLTTPFSTSKRSVTGSTQFGFFWPKDKTAEKLTTGIAAESLQSVGVGSKGFNVKKQDRK